MSLLGADDQLLVGLEAHHGELVMVATVMKPLYVISFISFFTYHRGCWNGSNFVVVKVTQEHQEAKGLIREDRDEQVRQTGQEDKDKSWSDTQA